MRLRVSIVLAAACTNIVYGQAGNNRLTLPELAKLHAPEPVVQVRAREIVLQSLEFVLPKADLVIHGRVERANSYLSDDQRDIYTDYVITPIRVMRQRIATASPRPGVQSPSPIIVRRWGGEVILDGVRVSQEDYDVREFKRGEELLLLLAFDRIQAKYVLPSDASGAFVVHGERIEPILLGGERKPIFDKVRQMNLVQFETEVLRFSK